MLQTKFIAFPTGEDITSRISEHMGNVYLDGKPLSEELVWEIALGERDNPQTIPTGIILVAFVPLTLGTIFWIPMNIQVDTDLISYMEGEYFNKSYFCIQNSMFIGSNKSVILKPIV